MVDGEGERMVDGEGERMVGGRRCRGEAVGRMAFRAVAPKRRDFGLSSRLVGVQIPKWSNRMWSNRNRSTACGQTATCTAQPFSLATGIHFLSLPASILSRYRQPFSLANGKLSLSLP